MAKNTSDQKASTAARPTDKQGRRTTGSIARTRRIVGILGNLVGVVALLVCVGAIAWLLNLTAAGNSISSVVEDDVAGTSTIAFPTLMALLSMTGFFFGQFAVRGRWGMGGDPSRSGGSFKVDLRPISVGLHAVLLAAAVLAWVLVMVLPVVADARGAIDIPDGSSAAEQFWFTVTVYGAITGVLAAMVKKLTYNTALRAHQSSITKGSHSQEWWRRFSHIWRTELGIAGFGGAALGLSPLGVHLGSATYGFGALAIGVALLAVATLAALNSWRSGLPVERVESYT
ncbi:hypothetical protein [Cryobacterium sp. AP23]